jgi:hypothetical protein
MAALGLTQGHFAIGTTDWGQVRAGSWIDPEPTRDEIWHAVPLSTIKPHKDLGPKQITAGGLLLCTSANVDTFKAAVMATTAKRFSWHNGTQELYLKVYSGQITRSSILVMNAVTCVFEVTFEFTSYDTRLYKASDDSVLWGAL